MLEIQFTDSIKVPCREECKSSLNVGDKKKLDIKYVLHDSAQKIELSQACPLAHGLLNPPPPHHFLFRKMCIFYVALA